MFIVRASQTPGSPAQGTLNILVSFWLPCGHSGMRRGQRGSGAWLGVSSTQVTLSFPLENGNRYEGYWQRGMKNGSGRFFHLDHGQLFEGFWVDDVAKCGTMIDFGRDEAPEPTQFPIPKVGSTHQGPVATPRETENSTSPPNRPHPGLAQPSPAREQTRFCFQSGHPHGDWQRPRQIALPESAAPHKVGSTPQDGGLGLACSPIQPLTASLQIEILDPNGVLEEALAMFKKTEEDED